MKIFFKGKDEQLYKLVLLTESPELIDAILDQFNIGEVEYIKEEEFNLSHTMDIDIMDESGQVKLGTLTCKNLYASPAPAIPEGKNAEEILDRHYKKGMHWKTVNRANVLAAMEAYKNQPAPKD